MIVGFTGWCIASSLAMSTPEEARKVGVVTTF
jgi:hypothetical protein